MINTPERNFENYEIVTYPEANDYYATLNTSVTAHTFLGVGNYEELVPADTITSDSYVVGIIVKFSDADRAYRLRLAKGDSGSEVDFIDISTPAAGRTEAFAIPIPRKKLEANVRLSFDGTDNEAAANVITLSVQLEVQS